MDQTSLIQIIVIIILLLLSAFFSSAETALSSVSRVKVRTLEDEKVRHAHTLGAILDRYDSLISTILVGNNIVNLTASSLMTTVTMRLFGNLFVSIATGILTILVLIFGEILPKTLARRNAESIALFYAPIMRGLMTVMFPVVFLIEGLAHVILKLLGKDKPVDNVITESELRTYVDVSHENGEIETSEKKMINNVFDFGDSYVKDVMVPRIDIVAVEKGATYDEVRKVFCDSMYTRLPVYDEEPDNIVGFINVKDFILIDRSETFCVGQLIRKAHFTYEYKRTNDLLKEMRDISTSLSVITNEYGEIVGMVTLEDLLEEIVGEIRDEYDKDEDDFIRKVNGGYLILANRKIEDVNDYFGTDFDSENYDTIGGLILEHLDRLPKDKERVTLEDGTVLEVRGIRQNRILKIFLTLPPQKDTDETPTANADADK